MTPLTGTQCEQLVAGICETFDEPAFVRFVRFRLDIDLYQDVGRNLPFKQLAFDFLQQCDRRGEIDKLLLALIEERPNEVRFQEHAGSLLPAPSSQPPELVRGSPPSPPPTPTPTPPPPQTAAEWLVEAARRVPAIGYAFGVVGLVAAAAISLGGMFGNWQYALFGGLATFIGTVLVRIYASFQPIEEKISLSTPIKVILWTCVATFVVVVAMAVVNLGLYWFGQHPETDSSHINKTKFQEDRLANQLLGLAKLNTELVALLKSIDNRILDKAIDNQQLLQERQELNHLLVSLQTGVFVPNSTFVDRLDAFVRSPSEERWSITRKSIATLQHNIAKVLDELSNFRGSFSSHESQSYVQLVQSLGKRVNILTELEQMKCPSTQAELDAVREVAKSYRELMNYNAIFMGKLADYMKKNK